MTATVPAAFFSLCQRFFVDEVDYLVLESEEIFTCNDFFFRYSNEKALEKFLADTLYVHMGVRNAATGAAETTPRNSTLSVEEFCTTKEVGNMRRLWYAAKSAASVETQKLVEESHDEKPKRLNTQVIEDLVERAEGRGFVSDIPQRRPAIITISLSLIHI